MPFTGVGLNPNENVYVIRSADDLPDEFDEYVIYHLLYDAGDGTGLYMSPDGVNLVKILEVPYTDTFWDDMRMPASAIDPPGTASDPDFDTTNGGWLFAATGTELIFLQVQIPHTWNEGTTLKPHVHWQKTTSAAGNVVWELQYKWAPIAEVMDAAFTTLSSSTVVPGTPDNNTANEHLITSLGDISATGKQISDMLMMKFSRLGSDAADTYGADSRLLEFDIHYEVSTPGSDQEFIK